MAAAQLEEVLAYADAAQKAVSRTDRACRMRVQRLIAEAHQLSGWMLFDRGSVSLAEKAFATARQSAEQADALDLLAFIGGPNSAFMSIWSGDPAGGAERAYGALAWARRSGNRRLAAFVSTMAARAHARMGEAELCTQMLVQAEAELSRHHKDEPDPVWLEVFDEAALAGHRGSCLLDLGQPGQAVDSLREQASVSAPIFVRNRTIWLLEQGEAQLRMGQFEAAATSVEQAINAVGSGAITPRVLRMFRSIGLKLNGCPDPAVTTTNARLARFIAACA
ncbi:hypothetical protein [Nocardia bhagyanarayanae]|nr:hypothetical protein [Nocardia bhagyanarayanae]